ncbi:MAG: hypothetical protein WKF75_13085 [Singulisphaera sp.]
MNAQLGLPRFNAFRAPTPRRSERPATSRAIHSYLRSDVDEGKEGLVAVVAEYDRLAADYPAPQPNFAQQLS